MNKTLSIGLAGFSFVIEEQEEAYFTDKTANKKSRPSFSSA